MLTPELTDANRHQPFYIHFLVRIDCNINIPKRTKYLQNEALCEGFMGESQFNNIKVYADLNEERHGAYFNYWNEDSMEDSKERFGGLIQYP